MSKIYLVLTAFFLALFLSGIYSPAQARLLTPVPTPSPQEKPDIDIRSWTRSPYKKEISAASAKYNLDPQLIYATIMTESEGKLYAFRWEPHLDDASLCLGQILVGTARSLGFTDDPKKLFEPEICIDLIGKYHRHMLGRYGDLTPLQLATAYNTGSPFKRPVRGHLIRFQMWFEEV